MLIRFISLDKAINGDYQLREIMINPKHIVMVQEEPSFKRLMEEGKLPNGLLPEVRFSSVTVLDSPYHKKIVVVGSALEVESKIYNKSKQLLRG
tara:strand:- start:3135 stop:3416 length:282 start_codon:yes stop_codon:yes gene_type:complete